MDWLRFRSTNSSTKSAPDRDARLITPSTSDGSSSGILWSVPITIPSLACGGGLGWVHRFPDQGDHPDPKQREHRRGGDEDGGKPEGRCQRRSQQWTYRVPNRRRAAGQSVRRSAQLRRRRQPDDGVGCRDQDTEEDAESGAKQQELTGVLSECLREKQECS